MKALLKRMVVRTIQLQAKLVLAKYKPHIVVVVGSVGKTTTKDAIYALLREKGIVRKSEKSFNSEVGIPLTILGCKNAWANPFLWTRNILDGIFLILFPSRYPEWLVLEVGADRPGDIKNIASWLRPEIIVYTRLPDIPVHVEHFSSPEQLVEEKLSLVGALQKDGTLVLNGDDETLRGLISKNEYAKTITYGFEKNNHFKASHYQIIYKDHTPTGIRFRINWEGKSIPVEIFGSVGRTHVYPALAAFALGNILGLDQLSMGEGLREMIAPAGRMRIIPGIKESVIIDDSYNSSPVAVDEALVFLEHIKITGKKIIVLGDMLELGKYSIEEHKRIGKLAAKIVDVFITVGFRARHMAEGALLGGMSEKKILQYEDATRAGKELEQKIKPGDIILVKGSQGIRLERTVEEIMAEPLRKNELLVRQERAWQKR